MDFDDEPILTAFVGMELFMSKLSLGLALGLLCTAGGMVLAQATSPGAAITAAVSGNTISGNMAASGAFEEFFAENGQIRGNGYSGQWRVDGNALCLAYDGDPPGCWELMINGNAIIWIGRSGEEGTGTIIKGNPAGY